MPLVMLPTLEFLLLNLGEQTYSISKFSSFRRNSSRKHQQNGGNQLASMAVSVCRDVDELFLESQGDGTQMWLSTQYKTGQVIPKLTV